MAFFTHHSVWKRSKTSIFHWFVRWRVWKQFPDYSDNLFSILNKMCQTSVFYGAIFTLYAQLASLASLQIDIITSFLMISKHYAFLLQLSSIPKKKPSILYCIVESWGFLVSFPLLLPFCASCSSLKAVTHPLYFEKTRPLTHSKEFLQCIFYAQ